MKNKIQFNEEFASESNNGKAVFSASVNGRMVGTFQFLSGMIVFTSLDDSVRGNSVTIKYDDTRQLVDDLRAMKLNY